MADDKNTQQSGQGSTQHDGKDTTPPDEVFEDIFEHIDVDSVVVDTPKVVNKKTPNKKTASKLKKRKTEPAKKDSSTATPPATTVNKKSPHSLDIEDISEYIASAKAKQEQGDKEPLAKDGTKLASLPDIYAIIPHVKGDHKIVFLRDAAPTDLVADDKGRVKGSEYIKKGMKIYDVHADFKEHPTLRSSNGEALDIWVIDNHEDLVKQLAAIQAGKGGGTNFGAPLIIGASSPANKKKVTSKKKDVQPKATSQTSKDKEKDTKKETKKQDASPKTVPVQEETTAPQTSTAKEKKVEKEDGKTSSPLEETQKENNKEREKEESTQEASETKPRETPVEDKKSEDKKPWGESVEAVNKKEPDSKPWATDTDTKKDEPKPMKEEKETGDKKQEASETKPRETPVEDKKNEDKKPWGESVEAVKKKEPDSKPWATDTDTKKDEPKPMKEVSPTPSEPDKTQGKGTERANTKESKSQQTKVAPQEEKKTDVKINKKEGPFSNAVEQMHEHDRVASGIPSPISLDNTVVKTVTPPKKKEGMQTITTSDPVIKEGTKVPLTAAVSTDKNTTQSVPKTPKKEAPISPMAPAKNMNVDSMFTSPNPEQAASPTKVQEAKTTTEKTTTNIDQLAPTATLDYPKAQVTKEFSAPQEQHPIYNEVIQHDEEEETPEGRTTKQKVWILLSMVFFIIILGVLIRFIKFMFFSNISPQDQEIDMPNTVVVEQPDNNVPEVIPEDEALNNGKPIVPTEPTLPEPEEPTPKPEPTDESFTLPELSAKLEAQQREAQRLVKDAKFIGDKKAIMFATTAAIKANSLLSEIEDNVGVTATEIQEGAEKIDFYLQEAHRLLD